MSTNETSDGPYVAYTLALTQNVRSSLVFVRESAAELASKVGWLLRQPTEEEQVSGSGPSPLRRSTRAFVIAQSVSREAEALKLTCDAIFPEVERLLAVVAGEPSLSLYNATETESDSSPTTVCDAAGQAGGLRRRSPLVGRGWGGAHGSPGNGYESLLCILWHLLQRLEVETALTNREATERRARQRASRRSPRVFADFGLNTTTPLDWRELERRWLAQRTSANQLTPLGRLAGHHLQLKQFYAMIHLACRCVQESEVARTLFVPHEAEFDHRVWAPAVKLDSFRGVHFGFQYNRDVRTVLRIVQVIRSAVHRAVSSEYFRKSTLARKIAFLSWGWFYIHLALLENYGYSTSSAQQIIEKLANTFGANPSTMSWLSEDRETSSTESSLRPALVSLDEARMFFNLSEDPIFMGFALMRDKEVALDRYFEITNAAETMKHVLEMLSRGRAPHGNATKQTCGWKGQLAPLDPERGPCRVQVPSSLDGPIKVRLLSYASRPVQVELSRVSPSMGREETAESGATASRSASSPTTVDADCWQAAYEEDEQIVYVADSSTTWTGRDASVSLERPGQGPAEDGVTFATSPHANLLPQPSMPNTANATPPLEHNAPVAVDEKAECELDQKLDRDEPIQVTRFGGRAEPEMPASLPNKRETTSQAPSDACRSTMDPSRLKIERKRPIMRREPSGSRLTSAISASMRTLGARIDLLLRSRVHGEPARTLIIFMHGGGFIGQSSLTHTSLLKQIAHDVQDAVVLSIDYRLAPEFPYPTAVNECLHGYVWALEHADRLGTRAERVVLAGDSAGGNLAVAVTIQIIEHGLRLPDGLILAYPALNLTLQWSPSRLMSAFDPLLSIDLLELILQSYIPADVDASRDPCLSPCIAASDALLEAFPPVYMICGSYDPLLDDSAVFAHRLRLVKRDKDGVEWVRLRVYDGMPHGFLSMSGAIRKAAEAVGQVTSWLSELLQVPWCGDHPTPSSPWTPGTTPNDRQSGVDATSETPLSESNAFRQAMRELSFAFSDSDRSEDESDLDEDERVPLFSMQSMDSQGGDRVHEWGRAA
ncbi:hypothetical protein CCYA_CCYA01G0034 [Cyanidiococcus yangmingshanensis]|nr:hypothetical protein CCYA_CCYA01G0034 [Cyanidiococcus yangmingshanensis]